MLILGFSLCTALIFAYVARYAILFILISLAPLVLTLRQAQGRLLRQAQGRLLRQAQGRLLRQAQDRLLRPGSGQALGTVRELRWLFWLWLKGLVLMLLLGPANDLLLKLAHVAAVSGLGEISSLFGGVKFLTATAVLSVLLTIDYAVIKGVFGAIGEIAGKAKATAQQIVAGLVTLGGIVLTGGLAGLGTSASPSALLRTGSVEPLGAAAAGGTAAIQSWTPSSRPFLS